MPLLETKNNKKTQQKNKKNNKKTKKQTPLFLLVAQYKGFISFI